MCCKTKSIEHGNSNQFERAVVVDTGTTSEQICPYVRSQVSVKNVLITTFLLCSLWTWEMKTRLHNIYLLSLFPPALVLWFIPVLLGSWSKGGSRDRLVLGWNATKWTDKVSTFFLFFRSQQLLLTKQIIFKPYINEASELQKRK